MSIAYFITGGLGAYSTGTGSGLTAEEHAKLMAIPTTPLLAADYVAPDNAAIALLLAANWTWTKSGDVVTYVSPDGLTHISYTPNASGGVDAAIV